MAPIGVRTPLDGPVSGAHTLKSAASQNIKTLLLTNPGERTSDGNFGVGIKKYLFEQDMPTIRADLKTRIASQINIYIPFVRLLGVEFSPQDDFNVLGIRIIYSIVPAGRDTGGSESEAHSVRVTHSGDGGEVSLIDDGEYLGDVCEKEEDGL